MEAEIPVEREQPVATVSGGSAKIIRIAVQSDVQQNIGMRITVMPGQRSL